MNKQRRDATDVEIEAWLTRCYEMAQPDFGIPRCDIIVDLVEMVRVHRRTVDLYDRALDRCLELEHVDCLSAGEYKTQDCKNTIAEKKKYLLIGASEGIEL